VGEGAVVPQDVVRVRIDQTVLVLPIEAFMSKYKLQEVEFDEGLHEIGEAAFDSCSALKDIHLSDGIERIGDNAFFDCTALRYNYLMESRGLVMAHSPGATSPNSDARHSLQQSLGDCSSNVKECFRWRCQKTQFDWNAMRAVIVIPYEMLPSR
jgi:hypothetical protein